MTAWKRVIAYLTVSPWLRGPMQATDRRRCLGGDEEAGFSTLPEVTARAFVARTGFALPIIECAFGVSPGFDAHPGAVRVDTHTL